MILMSPKDHVESRGVPSGDTCPLQLLWYKAEEIVGSGINKKLSSILIFIILISIILFMIILLYYFYGCITEISTVIQPFEIGNGTPQIFSGVSLANSLCFELTRIAGVELGPSSHPPFNKLPGSTDEKYAPQKNNFHTSALEDNNIYQVVKLDISGVSLSFGYIIPFLKKLTHHQGSTITGSFQRYGSTLRIVVNFYDPDSQGKKNKAWEVKRTLPNEESAFEVIPVMIEDLAYKIRLDLIRDEDRTTANNYPQIWDAFKDYTLAWEEYHMYNVTRNYKYLETAGRKALLVKSSEPNCPGSDNLLFSLAYTWNDKGVDLAQQGKYDEAINAFEKAIVLGHNYADIWNNKGVAFKDQRKYNEAFEAFNTAINLSIISASAIERAAAWKNKGWTLKDMDRQNDAIDAFETAIRLKPDYAEAWVGKGWTLKDMGRQNDAIAAFETAIRLKPDYAEAWLGKGWTLKDMDRQNDAIAAFEEAIHLKPDCAEAWDSEGWTFMNMSKYDQANQSFERAIQLKPAYANAWLGKGRVLNITGRHDEAIQAFNAVIWLFEVHLRPEPDYAETPSKLKSDYIDALNGKGNALKALGRTTEADAAFTDAKGLGYEG